MSSAPLSRRAVVAGTLSAGLIGAGLPLRHARAAEYVLKLGTDVPDTHPINIHARKAADAIREQTNGRVDLQIFANNQLGGQSDMLSQLRSGALECFALSGVNVLSTIIPTSSIYGLGFAFPDYDAVWRGMDGPFGQHLRGQIEKAGFVVMEKIWDNGFRQITNSVRPIKEPKDLQGLKIRVPVSALWTSLFRSLGAAPTSLNFAEVYSALQTKVVDGQENPPVIINTAKIYEVQKYCSVTNHMWDGWWFLINRRAWNQLPAELKDVFARNVDAACLEERKDVARLNASLREELVAKGLAFNDVDTAPFKDELRKSGFYAEWRKKFGDEAMGLLEAAAGKLG
ncbi:ABC transporter substrate-binding protein [Methylobacterium variabile]|jgi:tripartite ATP-independent transporter DctP family solute receptor|uniref:ABC transporter substrate-binding protein n=1 Tax=Methylobacterium variabile TaxID=298794 RepID=A0A0J6SRR0_9HYPH|nr:TRAP transporter substrate-binding protein [Methylobacterium variabile]KMO36384.1 ABC transporter substrate-binding protein [Methylobacterium variabile]